MGGMFVGRVLILKMLIKMR